MIRSPKKSFFLYIKMSKNSSAKYYQKTQRNASKKACESYQYLIAEKNSKKQLYGFKHKKITQNLKSKGS